MNVEEGENMHKQQRKNQEDKDGFQEVESKRKQVRENTDKGKKNNKPSQEEKKTLMYYKKKKKKKITRSKKWTIRGKKKT